MALASASGTPQNSGTLIPEIWSTKMKVKFYAATIFSAIANTNWEGELKQKGDVVHIRDVPTITVRSYVKGQDPVYEDPLTNDIELLCDQGEYFAFRVNRVDEKQSDLAFMNKWGIDAAHQMKKAVDTNALSHVYADAHASNQGLTAGIKTGAYNLGVSGTPFLVTRQNIIDLLCYLGATLDEQDVPEEGRWATLPPLLTCLLKLSDLKDASMMGDGTSALRNGRLGIIDRFTIYQSNLLTTTADSSGVTAYNCIAGTVDAIAFASQITETETLPNPKDFGKIFRGLQVYGYKVTNPEALAYFYVAKG